MLATGLRFRCLHAHLEDRFVRAWRLWVGQLPPHGVQHRLREQVAELTDHHVDHLVDSARFTDAWPVRRSSLTAFSRLPPDGQQLIAMLISDPPVP